MNNIKADAIVVGSGPIGAIYARLLVESGLSVALLDAGAQLSPRAGEHLKNAYIYQRDRNHFTDTVQSLLYTLSVPTEKLNIEGLDPSVYMSNAGVRNNMNPNQNPNQNLSSGYAAFAVGGMGIHWTCATPRLNPDIERWHFISEEEWDYLYNLSESLFNTHTNVFIDSLRGKVIKETLKEHLHVSDKYPVQQLPVAAVRRQDKTNFVHWTGPYDILAPIYENPVLSEKLTIYPQYLARKIILNASRVVAIEGQCLEPWHEFRATGQLFFVAAGAIKTPQLLYNSDFGRDIKALGCYLNDQPMTFTQVMLSDKIVKEIARIEPQDKATILNDNIPIPYTDPDPTLWIPLQENRLWHCQVHKDAFNYGKTALEIDDRLVLDFRWYTFVEPREENRVTFEEHIKDIHNMPQPTFHYEINHEEAERAHAMMADMTQTALTIGGFIPGAEPRFMPSGASIHYMSTYRMGTKNDGTCVVDPYSKVWDIENLYLGGPGTFPNATAANPTLTAGAMAIHSVEKITGKRTSVVNKQS